MITDVGGPRYEGLDRFEARRVIMDDLRAAGASSARSRTRRTSAGATGARRSSSRTCPTQWFCRMEELAAPAIEAVRDGRVTFHPERWTNVYMDWMENIRDWNISRQLWWGHRIPIWYCPCGERVASVEAPAACSGVRRAGADPGSGHPGHLVQLGAVADGDARLAGGHRGSAVFLPHERSGDRARHHLPVGRAHDHVRVGVPRSRCRSATSTSTRYPGCPTGGG